MQKHEMESKKLMQMRQNASSADFNETFPGMWYEVMMEPTNNFMKLLVVVTTSMLLYEVICWLHHSLKSYHKYVLT